MRALRLLGLGLVVVAGAALVGIALRAVAPGSEDEAAKGRVAPPRRATIENGGVVLRVSLDEQRASGLSIAQVELLRYQPEARGFATVLESAPLADARANRVATVIEMQRAAAALDAARQAVGRLAPLNRDNAIVSNKDLVAARTEAATAEAAWRLAEERKRLGEISLRRDWGDTIGSWLADGGPQLDPLLDGRVLLLRIALADPMRSGAPAGSAQLELPGNGRAQADIVGTVPHADPKFPGPTLFALAKPAERLRPGVTATAQVPWGAPLDGLFVPSDAVVRYQGKLWVYIASGAERFERRELPDAVAVPGGWLVSRSLDLGTGIVATGTQLLFSEELRGREVG